MSVTQSTTANKASPGPVKKREIFGWSMYDFANSSYTTVVVTFVYSAFFIAYIVPEEFDHLRNTFWSIAVTISTALAIILAPFVGVLCDYTGKKKKFLAYCTIGSVVGTAGLFFVNPGNVWLGLTFLIVSNTSWMLSESFIASFLCDIASKKNIAKVSGIGWGIGYIGGLLSLVLVMQIGSIVDDGTPEGKIWSNQVFMLFIALFYGLGTLPTFLLLKERSVAKPGFENADFSTLTKAALKRIIDMRTVIKQYPLLFKFFMAFMVYSAGVAVVVKFFGIYASEEIGITGGALIAVGATLQISSMIGAIGFGFLEQKLGARNNILLSLSLWMFGIVGIYSVEPIANMLGMSIFNTFVLLAFIAGSAMGATQSSSRAYVGQLTKPEDSALMFGLWGTFARFAIIIGMTFGPISDLLGRHSALLFILVYFIIGGLMLFMMPKRLPAELE